MGYGSLTISETYPADSLFPTIDLSVLVEQTPHAFHTSPWLDD